MPAISRVVHNAYRTEDARHRALINAAVIRYQTVEAQPPADTLTLIAAGLISADTASSPVTGAMIPLTQIHPTDQPDLRNP